MAVGLEQVANDGRDTEPVHPRVEICRPRACCVCHVSRRPSLHEFGQPLFTAVYRDTSVNLMFVLGQFSLDVATGSFNARPLLLSPAADRIAE